MILRLASVRPVWQHRKMIEFRPLSDDHPDLSHSPMLRAALLTLRYAQEHGAIGLTKTKAFKRVFVSAFRTDKAEILSQSPWPDLMLVAPNYHGNV